MKCRVRVGKVLFLSEIKNEETNEGSVLRLGGGISEGKACTVGLLSSLSNAFSNGRRRHH